MTLSPKQLDRSLHQVWRDDGLAELIAWHETNTPDFSERDEKALSAGYRQAWHDFVEALIVHDYIKPTGG